MSARVEHAPDAAASSIGPMSFYARVTRVSASSSSTRRRLDFDRPAGTGRVECLRLSSGLTVVVSDYRALRTLAEKRCSGPPALGFAFSNAGGHWVTTNPGSPPRLIAPGLVWMRAGGTDEPVSTTVPEGTRVRAVSLRVSPELIETWRGDERFAGRLDHPTSGNHALILPAGAMDERTTSLVDGVLALDLSGVVDCLRAESAALDLLAHALGCLTDVDRSRPLPRERAVLDEARDILEAEWSDPPSISRLARRVGMNECYLKARFKERFGTTIAGFVRDRRMREARRLIENEGWSVHAAASEVGFSNFSKFAAGFRGVHGVNPSVLRRRASG